MPIAPVQQPSLMPPVIIPVMGADKYLYHATPDDEVSKLLEALSRLGWTPSDQSKDLSF